MIVTMQVGRGARNSGYNIVFITLLMALNSLSSQAEIFKCRDASGRASFSQQPCPETNVVGNSEAHQLWREMRVLVNEGGDIYKKMGPDVPSIIACNNAAKAFGLKLDAIDKRLLSVSPNKHAPLFEAQRQLRECGRCRSSAVNYCKQASQSLDKEMAILLPPVVGR